MKSKNTSKIVLSLYFIGTIIAYFITYQYLNNNDKTMPTILVVIIAILWFLILIAYLCVNYQLINKAKGNNKVRLTKSIAYISLSTALICIFTMVSIPLPAGAGYIHIGDSIIFLVAYLLPLPFVALAAGLGSAFADIFLGYSVYAIPTLIFKAGMAIVARYFIMNKANIFNLIVGFVLSSLLMQAGYYFVNTVLFGEEISLFIFFINMIQTIVSVPIAIFFVKAITKVPDLQTIRNEWLGD